MPEPTPNTKAQIEFIADRTAPVASITGPAVSSELRGGHPHTISWNVADPHLHSTPITLSWARSGGSEPVVIAEALANSGSYEWTTPLDMTDGGTIFLTATDKANNKQPQRLATLWSMP